MKKMCRAKRSHTIQRVLGLVLLGLVLLGLALLGTGCRQTPMAQNLNTALGGWGEKDADSTLPEPIDIVPYVNADFAPALGFDVVDYPDNASLWPEKYFVLEGWYAQMEYTTEDGRSLVVRVAKADEKELYTTYVEHHYASYEEREIDGVEVKIRTSAAGSSMITWRSGDFQYLLHASKLYGMPPDEEIETMVTGLRAKLAEG